MDEPQLVQKCMQGDKQAWEEFLVIYSRLLYSTIHSVLRANGVSFLASEVSDLFNDVFVLLCEDNFRRLRQYKAINGCSFKSWLRVITVNATIDYIRRQRPHISMDDEVDEAQCLKEVLHDSCASIAEKASHEEVLRHLKECIQRLALDEKHFLQLHIDLGLTLEELKDYFGLSRGAVDMRKARIVGKLRTCFSNKGVVVS